MKKYLFNPSGRLFNMFPGFVFLKYRPDKSRQFTRNRHCHFTRHLAAMRKMSIAFSKPLSGSISNIDHPLRLIFSSFSQGFADVAGMPIVPGNFHQNPSHPFIASPGDGASSLLFTTGELRTGKAQIAHQFTRRRKTSKIKYFRNDRNSTERINSMETTQKTNNFLVRFTFCQCLDLIVK